MSPPDPDPEFASPRRRLRLGVGAAIVVVVIAVAVTIAIGMLRGATTPTQIVPLASATIDETPAPEDLYVHIAGAVQGPGLYLLEPGARVEEAVTAAGGFTDDADPGGINLARPLTDGEQLRVPREGEEPAPVVPPGGSAGAPEPGASTAPVNLNTADLAALETLPGVGPAIAQHILDWREQNGAFTSVADLVAVSGIGEKTLETLRPLVTV